MAVKERGLGDQRKMGAQRWGGVKERKQEQQRE